VGVTGLLGRDAILAAADLPERTVAVPAWGGMVRVRGLTAREVLRWQAAYEDAEPWRRILGLVALCIVDGTGARLFTEADLEALAGKSPAAIRQVFDRCLEVNGLDAQATESAAKNSPGGRADASSSASPGPSA